MHRYNIYENGAPLEVFGRTMHDPASASHSTNPPIPHEPGSVTFSAAEVAIAASAAKVHGRYKATS